MNKNKAIKKGVQKTSVMALLIVGLLLLATLGTLGIKKASNSMTAKAGILDDYPIFEDLSINITLTSTKDNLYLNCLEEPPVMVDFELQTYDAKLETKYIVYKSPSNSTWQSYTSNAVTELQNYDLLTSSINFNENGIYQFAYAAYYKPIMLGGRTATAYSNTVEIHSENIGSGDSNEEDVVITPYSTPILSCSGSVVNINRGESFGTNYMVCIGDYASNTIDASITTESLTIDTSVNETFNAISEATTKDIWAVNLAQNLFLDSEKSNKLSYTRYAPIAVTYFNGIINWTGAPQNLTYNVQSSNDEVVKNKVASGKTSLDFAEFEMPAGIFNITVSVVAAENEIAISSSNKLILSIFQLGAPVIRVENQYLKWDAVPRASGYRIFYNDTYKDITETEIDIMSLGLDIGNYTFKVRSIGNMFTPAAANLRSISNYVTQMVAINYNVNGDLTQKLVEYGSKLILPTLDKANSTLEGWYYDSEFTNKAIDGAELTNSIVLYAKLIENVVEPPTLWQKIWNVAKPILIWGGVALGGVLVIVILALIVKRKRG